MVLFVDETVMVTVSSPNKMFLLLLFFLRNAEYLCMEFDNPSTAFEKMKDVAYSV